MPLLLLSAIGDSESLDLTLLACTGLIDGIYSVNKTSGIIIGLSISPSSFSSPPLSFSWPPVLPSWKLCST